MGGWEDGRMGGWEDGRMGGWEDGRMGGLTVQVLLRFGNIVFRQIVENVKTRGFLYVSTWRSF